MARVAAHLLLVLILIVLALYSSLFLAVKSANYFSAGQTCLGGGLFVVACSVMIATLEIGLHRVERI